MFIFLLMIIILRSFDGDFKSTTNTPGDFLIIVIFSNSNKENCN